MLWHNIWKDNGRPRSGIVADIRARTRASYHNIIKSVKRNENNIRACNMAKSFFDIDKRNFWTEIKKLRGKTCNLPSSIDGEHGERAITEPREQSCLQINMRTYIKVYRMIKTICVNSSRKLMTA